MDIGTEQQSLPVESVGTFLNRLVAEHYPQLYRKLTKIGALLQDLSESEPGIIPLQSIQMKIRSEMDELCRQEEETIFPLLFRLEQEQKKADSCKPFKAVKYHYSYLVSTLQQFKTQLLPLIRERKELLDLMLLKEGIMQFEQSLITVQRDKEQKLFNRFRNCNNGCKTL